MSLDSFLPGVSANNLTRRTQEVGLFYQNTHRLKTSVPISVTQAPMEFQFSATEDQGHNGF